MRNCLRWLLVAGCVNQVMLIPMAQCADRPDAVQTPARPNPEIGFVEVREFEVRVDNKPVGTHRLTVKESGTKQEVAFHTDVKLDYIVYAYIFKFRGTEIWNDGRLEYSDIRSEDGGKKRSFSLKTDGKIQQVSFNGKSQPGISSSVMSTAYWQLPPTDFRSKPLPIINVDTGTVHDATFKIVGPDTVAVDGRTVTCQHCKIDGPSPAELWFDEQDRLVRQKSIEQGHSMELRLKQIRKAKDEK